MTGRRKICFICTGWTLDCRHTCASEAVKPLRKASSVRVVLATFETEQGHPRGHSEVSCDLTLFLFCRPS